MKLAALLRQRQAAALAALVLWQLAHNKLDAGRRTSAIRVTLRLQRPNPNDEYRFGPTDSRLESLLILLKGASGKKRLQAS